MANSWRPQRISDLKKERYDILVIGGGATGCGIALDAVTRGLKTALVEMQDFASGTSSRSTKLIHGGLRYLKQFEVSLVRETGRERAIVHGLAPHLVVPEKMLLPIIVNGTYSKSLTSLGLRLYDILAGVKGDDRRKMLNKAQTLEKEPMLNPTVVRAGGYYAEYRTDDARLTSSLIQTAVNKGAHAINYVKALDFLYDGRDSKQVIGISAQDVLSGETFDIEASVVVNASGPWVDTLRATNQSLNGKHLHLTKGVHLVVPHSAMPIQQAIYFDSPDGRMIFAIPRGQITYIGTTDTDYKGDIQNPRTTEADVTYLLKAVNTLFPNVNLSADAIESSWAGLRPLVHEEGKSASEISRKDEIFVSETGLISIAGGKLTGYRKMAQRVVDLALKRLPIRFSPSKTHRVTLTGGEFQNYQEVIQFEAAKCKTLQAKGLPVHYAKYLVGNYGKQLINILQHFDLQNEEDKELALLLAELAYCLEEEMVMQPTDFFIRRTGRLYFDIQSVRKYLDPVLLVFSERFNWNSHQQNSAREAMELALHEASHFPTLPEKEVVH